jgi:hypothetical protein
MLHKFYLVVLIVLLAIPLGVFAQDDDGYSFEDPVFLWSAGQLDATDNSVYYSLFVASGAEAISDLTVTADVPEGATFVDAFWTPETSTFVGEADGAVSWELPALEAETIMGPFTFHVTFENADAEDFAPQGAATGSVAWGEDVLDAQAFGAETLSAVEASGSITIEPAGTVDLVSIGETGAWILVPADAVSETVTLTIERLAITEDSELPEAAEETWWCGQYSISADKDVTFSQPITLILPIRRALTPAMEVAVFGLSPDGEWIVQSDGEADTGEAETAQAFVSRDGVVISLTLDAASFSTDADVFAVGVSTRKRTTSTSSSTGAGDDSTWF